MLGVYSGKGIRGGGDGRVRSLSSLSGQALCWPKIVERSLQELTSAVALVLCIHTGVYELLVCDE